MASYKSHGFGEATWAIPQMIAIMLVFCLIFPQSRHVMLSLAPLILAPPAAYLGLSLYRMRTRKRLRRVKRAAAGKNFQLHVRIEERRNRKIGAKRVL
jgi:hypothetical protein